MSMKKNLVPKHLKDFFKIYLMPQQKIFFKSVFLMFIIGILEMLGIAIFFPAMKYIISIESLPFNFFSSKNEFIIFSALVFIFFMIIKNLLVIIFNSKVVSNLSLIRHYVSNRIFSSYLNSPYENHINFNQASIMRNLTTNLVEIYGRVLLPLGIMLTEMFVAILIAIILLIFDPVGVVVLFLLFIVPVIFFYKNTKTRMKFWGKFSQTANSKRINIINNMISGIKEIKIFNRQDLLQAGYKQNDSILTENLYKISATTQLGKYLLEILLVLSICGITVAYKYIYKLNDIESYLPYFGIYLFAAFKILPSISRILTAVQHIKFSEELMIDLNNLHLSCSKIIKLKKSNKVIDLDESICFEKVYFKYPNNLEYTLNNISFTIKKNSITGFSGSSGSGKTTLINLLLSFLQPSSGDIYIDKYKITKSYFSNFYALVPQDPFVFNGTIAQNIAFSNKVNKQELKKISNILKEVSLDGYVSKLDKGLNSNINDKGNNLSGGQKQRIAIARALYNNSKVIVLDEPTSALDKNTEKDIIKLITKLKNKCTVIVISHSNSLLNICDSVYTLHGGHLKKN